jgi:3-hydroxybutyryl-CoA dehydrogenase
MVKCFGVIGAGQMGGGIAHVAALAGLEVILSDVSKERAEAGLAVIAKNLDRHVKKGTLTEADAKAALARIRAVAGLKDLAGCDFVIEAATENADLKISILKELCPTLSPEAIVATNTSSISITRLGAVSGRPDKFMGMHFMNPVPVMKLVELIPGTVTSEATFAAVKGLAETLGKTPTVSADVPGFIANRVLMPMINEAIFAFYEGVGTVEAIDTTLKLGANQPMGPLALADLIGLDTCLAILRVLHEGFADSKYRPCPLLVKYVEAGWLGRKTGKGFYDYSKEPPAPVR